MPSSGATNEESVNSFEPESNKSPVRDSLTYSDGYCVLFGIPLHR